MKSSIPIDQEISLKLPKLQDADALFALVDQDRKYLRQHLPWVDYNVSVQDTKKFIRECRKNFKSGAGFSLLIVYRGKIVGTIGIHYLDRTDKRTEMGYWLGKKFQGKGIMRKCCRAMIQHLFHDFSLNRIEIRCAVNNHASRRLAEALGFTQEGVLRKNALLNGTFVDTAVYGYLASDDRKSLSF